MFKNTYLSFVQNDESVIVDDRTQAVGHWEGKVIRGSAKMDSSKKRHTSQQQRIIELFADSALDFGVGCKINATRCLIENDDGAAPEERSSHRDQLSLPL